MLVCEGYHDMKVVPYRCKGRFCTTCSCGETEEWSRLLAEDVFQVKHRHVILTIDEGMRDILLWYLELLKVFMDEGVWLIRTYFENKHHLTPGIIAGLHMFGSRLKFNTHIHMLVTMGGMTAYGEWKKYDYIPFEMCANSVANRCLKANPPAPERGGEKESSAASAESLFGNGDRFYIHASKQTGDIQAQLGYMPIMRRPAIAENRIEAYDGKIVTIRYHDKKDGKEKRESISVEEFIARLTRHISDEQFKFNVSRCPLSPSKHAYKIDLLATRYIDVSYLAKLLKKTNSEILKLTAHNVNLKFPENMESNNCAVVSHEFNKQGRRFCKEFGYRARGRFQSLCAQSLQLA